MLGFTLAVRIKTVTLDRHGGSGDGVVVVNRMVKEGKREIERVVKGSVSGKGRKGRMVCSISRADTGD